MRTVVSPAFGSPTGLNRGRIRVISVDRKTDGPPQTFLPEYLYTRLEVGSLELFLSLNAIRPELMELLGQEQFEKFRKNM